MSLWDDAVNTNSNLVVRPKKPKRKEKGIAQNTTATKFIEDDSLSQSLLHSEQELVSPQLQSNSKYNLNNQSNNKESALLSKISGIRLVSEQDLIEEETRDRTEALTRLHGDVNKVHEVFADIQSLVAQQSEGVTSIENDIEAAHSSTTSGVDQLTKASKHQKQGFKCIIIALAVTAGILALFAVAVVLYSKYAL